MIEPGARLPSPLHSLLLLNMFIFMAGQILPAPRAVGSVLSLALKNRYTDFCTPSGLLSGPGAELGVREGGAELEASRSVQGCGCSWGSHSVQQAGPGAEGLGPHRVSGLETERGTTEREVTPPPPTTLLPSSGSCPKADEWCSLAIRSLSCQWGRPPQPAHLTR